MSDGRIRSGRKARIKAEQVLKSTSANEQVFIGTNKINQEKENEKEAEKENEKENDIFIYNQEKEPEIDKINI